MLNLFVVCLAVLFFAIWAGLSLVEKLYFERAERRYNHSTCLKNIKALEKELFPEWFPPEPVGLSQVISNHRSSVTNIEAYRAARRHLHWKDGIQPGPSGKLVWEDDEYVLREVPDVEANQPRRGDPVGSAVASSEPDWVG